MRFFDDGLHILNERAAEDDVRDGHDQRLFVDGIEQALGVDVDGVVVGHHVDACAARTLCASQKYMTEGKFRSV